MVSSEIITRSERDYHRVSPTPDDKGNYPRMNFVLAGRGAINPVMAQGRGGADTLPAWATAGGAPRPIACYQAKGAASLAASYINLANPGTYDAAPGVAPAWDAASGWTFAATYLLTGIIPSGAGWSMIIRFSDCTPNGVLAGTRGDPRMYIYPASWTSFQFGYGDGTYTYGTAPAAGVAAIAGANFYLDGALLSAISFTWTGAPSYGIAIGGLMRTGTVDTKANAKIQALAIYNATLSAAQVAAISAAMAAL